MFPLKTTEKVNSWPVVTWLLIAVNVFVFTQQLTVTAPAEFVHTWGLVPAHYPHLFSSSAHIDLLTPEALLPLLDKQMPGFGELFRALSFEEIGTASLQSRAFGGLANRTVIFCMPGSTGACRTAWVGIIQDQLDSTFQPCNFAPILLGKYAH